MADWHLYCDESSTNKAFMVFGGVLVRADIVPILEARIDDWRDRDSIKHEFSWKKTSPPFLEQYKLFATGTMQHVTQSRVAFRCTVFDRNDNALFRGTTRADSYAKRMHQFILHSFLMRLKADDSLYIYPDHEFLPCPAEELRGYLNGGLAKRRCLLGCEVVKRIEPRSSDKSHFIQMADVLSGAVAAYNNRDYDPGSKRGAAKQELMEHVVQLAGGMDFAKNGFGRGDFRVWHFCPVKRAAP